MDLLEHLDSRRHVLKFKDELPPRNDIEEVLWKAWKVTPSKQNFMPYQITILGPEAKEEKIALWNLARANKKHVNESHSSIPWEEDGDNGNYLYLKTAPYSIIFSQRVCKPNPFVERCIRDLNDHYEQMHESGLDAMMRTTAVEIGMFAANMGTFALEKGIQVNYNACFPSKIEKWSTLPIIKYNPLLIGGMGYCEVPRRNSHSAKLLKDDLKPELSEMLKWI